MRRTIANLLVAMMFLATASGRAAELTVQVRDSHGRAVADAVVTVLPLGKSDRGVDTRRHAPVSKRIDQEELAFTPYIEIFRPGDDVVFHNSDRTRHHVYSFSPIKAFELVLAYDENSTPQRLEKSGVIAVGCNIHDQMITYLYVSDAPWIARSDVDGSVEFHGLPAGAYDVRVWQPRLRPGNPDLAQSTTIVKASESKVLTFALSLMRDPRLQFDREHTRY